MAKREPRRLFGGWTKWTHPPTVGGGYQIIKVKGKNLYKVINEISGKVHSKASTKENAEKQIRLMEMFDNTTRKNKVKK